MKPLLISGIGRSGTSALIKALSLHDEVLAPSRIGEAPFVNRFTSFLLDYENDSSAHDYHLKNYQLDEGSRQRLFGDLVFRLQYGETADQAEDTHRFWCAKCSMHANVFDKAQEIFGEVRVVHIVRNGVEVVNSARKFAGFSHLDFRQLCERWVGNAQNTRYLEDSPLAASVRHDRLVADPQSVFAALFERLGMAPDTKPGEFIGSTIFNSSFRDSGSGLDSSKAFDDRTACWNEWTTDEKRIFTDICDTTMQRYGFSRPYAAEGSRASAPRAALAVWSKVPDAAPAPRENVSPLEGLASKTCSEAMANYHLSPSLRHNYLFVENPKVASTTILDLLQRAEAAASGEPLQMRNPHDRPNSPLPRLLDLPPAEQEKLLYGDDVFRFTFVRNPYARLLSAYLTKIDRPLKPKRQILARLHGVDESAISDLEEAVSFDSFVEIVCSMESPDMDPHWKPQVDQIFFDRLAFDFVGRFESLQEDLTTVARRLLDLAPDRIGHSSNRTGASDLLDSYYELSTQRKVLERFARDFETFGYSEDITVLSKVA